MISFLGALIFNINSFDWKTASTSLSVASQVGIYLIWNLFFYSGKQLSKKAVKSTRAIASVRIHVERAIGRLKDFRILQGNFLVPMLPIADNIFSVCAALCNLLPPLAK